MAKTFSAKGIHTISRTLGLACAIHCISLPFLLAFLPGALSHFLSHPMAEAGFALFSLVFLSITLLRDYKKHKIVYPACVVLLGFFLLVGQHFWSHDHDNLIIPIISGVVMLIGFWLNWRAAKASHVCSTAT